MRLLSILLIVSFLGGCSVVREASYFVESCFTGKDVKRMSP